MLDENDFKEYFEEIGNKIGRDIVFTVISEFCKLLSEKGVVDIETLKEASSQFLSYQATQGLKMKSAVVVSRAKKPSNSTGLNNVTAQLLSSVKSRGYTDYVWEAHPIDKDYEYAQNATFPSTGRYILVQKKCAVGAGSEDGELFEMLASEKQDAAEMGLLNK